MKKLTQKQLKEKLAILEPDSKWQRNSLVCSLVGHSRIRTLFFGGNYCARCETQLGDSLDGAWQQTDEYIEGHDDKECLEALAKMGWQDKLYVPKNIYATNRKEKNNA